LLLQRFTRRLRAFDNLNLRVVNMRQHLPEVPHVEVRPADRAIAEMSGLGLGDAVRRLSLVARQLAAQCLSFPVGLNTRST
jgi:hypothetical protein